MKCPFCNLNNLESRTFYKTKYWVAFLAAPYHTKGHTILIKTKGEEKECPEKIEKFDEKVLTGMGCAIAKVSKALMSIKHCNSNPERILFASLRGDIKHFHIHLIPLWKHEEKKWRKKQIENNHLCYEKGHLLEYLGYLEREGDQRASKERNEKGWTFEEQRKAIIEDNGYLITRLRSAVRQR